jgi:PAS domain S-box-containing protein
VNVPAADPRETLVLVLAPTGRDAALIESILAKAGIAAEICADVVGLCRELASGAGAVLLAEEAIADPARARLVELIEHQPTWSDLPLLVLTYQGADSPTALRAAEDLGNVTLLERPIRVAALISGVRSALRARQRQYQIRSSMAEAQQAAQTRAVLAAIVESSNDAMVSKTLDGIITSWNPGAERLFEYSAEEVIGRSIMLIVPPERQDEERRILAQLRRGLRIQDFETERVTKSGRRIDISVSVSPLRDETGRIVGASKVARDITARKRADAALKEADRRKDEFLATLAHELRNPLAPIRSSLQTLAMAKSGNALAPALAIMNRQVDHMVRLIDDLLEVSRITRGKIELRRERVPLGQVIASAVETSRPLIDAAGHELFVEGPGGEVMLDADPVRLSQVFANLLNNAAKYTERAGEIRLTIRADGPDAVITVRDTGIGIAREMLPHVFDMFVQVGRADRVSQEGLGIGLSLVRSLVEMHGGTVAANSAGVGRGSEFVVRLPVAAEERAPEPGSPRRRREQERWTGFSVLVVDDNRDAADSLGGLLETLGAEVRIAYDGASALELLASAAPDVALLDIGMPGMDGYDLAHRIRSEPQYRDVALIAVTGWGNEQDLRRAKEAGFDHHVGKPASVAELRSLVCALRSAQRESD